MNLQQLISLPDIARLAQVQRPVVSVWRTRSRGTQFPFPDPKQTNGSQELFASAEIVHWLQETGRGNNPEFKEDSAAYTTLARRKFPRHHSAPGTTTKRRSAIGQFLAQRHP